MDFSLLIHYNHSRWQTTVVSALLRANHQCPIARCNLNNLVGYNVSAFSETSHLWEWGLLPEHRVAPMSQTEDTSAAVGGCAKVSVPSCWSHPLWRGGVGCGGVVSTHEEYTTVPVEREGTQHQYMGGCLKSVQLVKYQFRLYILGPCSRHFLAIF